MNAFIDEHRAAHGVEPICRALAVAPSGYWLHARRLRQLELLPERARRDERLGSHIERVYEAH